MAPSACWSCSWSRAPVLSVFAGHWAYRAFASQQQDQRAWREVTAVLLQAAPLEPGSYDVSESWTRSGGPPGRARAEGTITATAGTPAGSRVRIRVDGSGQWAGPPLSRRWSVRVAAAVMVTIIMLATVLAAVASFVRWWLIGVGWPAGADWNSVGPRWTRQFWAGG